MESNVIYIEKYQDADEIVFPEIQIPYRLGCVIGIYTDPKSAQHLLREFLKKENIDVHLKEDALYRKLTVKEHVNFFRKIYESDEDTSSLLNLTRLEHESNTRINRLSYSDAHKLHFLKYYLSECKTLIMEEPFQNVNNMTKQTMINMMDTMESKMIIIISNNLEDLVNSSEKVFRLDKSGLNILDVKNDQDNDKSPVEEIEFRVDKIPTKKDEKIILFNPPEIDYIESVSGEVNIYVAGNAYVCSLTLAELEKRLVPLGFFRCHRSYIVNLQKVREIITWTRNSYSLSLDTTTNTTVPLSKNKLPVLKQIVGI